MDEEKKKIKRLVEDLVCSTDLQLDQQKMKILKSKCKTSDDCLSEVHQQLFRNLAKKNSDIRILCLDILDELFSRSHYFRTQVLESFDSITLLCVGVDSLNPLPLPAAAARKLQSNAIRIIKGWMSKYGGGYTKLKVCYEALKRKVNFDSLTLINGAEETARRKERERMEALWRTRLLQVEKEVQENQETVDSTIVESMNCIELWKTSGNCVELTNPVVAAVADQFNILDRRLLPLSKKWTDTLTKAGNLTNHELLRNCVELKNRLDKLVTEMKSFGIQFNQKRDKHTKEKKVEVSGLFEDPTTWAASVVRLKTKNKTDLPNTITSMALNQTFLQDKRPSSNPSDEVITVAAHKDSCGSKKFPSEPGCSKTVSSVSHVPQPYSSEHNSEPFSSPSQSCSSAINPGSLNPSSPSQPCGSKEICSQPDRTTSGSPSFQSIFDIPGEGIPKLKLSELLTEDRMVVDQEKSSLWLNGEREGYCVVVNPGIRRVVDFSGKFEPVTRACHAPLENGSLCPRMDRFKCPFHGPIINRDSQGAAVGFSVNPEGPLASKDPRIPEPGSKKNKSPKKLKSEATRTDSSRSRLEQKVFSKNAVKRVSRRLDAIDAKRTKSLFGEQFNYSM